MTNNFGQMIMEVAQNIGKANPDGTSALDSTTVPTLSRVKDYINETLQEAVNDFPYESLIKNVWVPFNHLIHDVPSAYLTGVSISPNAGDSVEALMTPWPDDKSLKAGKYIFPPGYNFSGVAFSGFNSVDGFQSAISTSGYQTTATWSGVGYFYELPEYVDSIIQIQLPQRGVTLQVVPNYDLNIWLPQGIWSTSGTTQAWYSEVPGVSQSGNKVIEFFPMPNAQMVNEHFFLTYKDKQVPLVNNGDTQSIIPSQFQSLIVNGALEKCYALLDNMPKSQYHEGQKTKLVMQMRKWSENNPNYVNRYRDGHYTSNVGVGPVGADLALGFMINGFGR